MTARCQLFSCYLRKYVFVPQEQSRINSSRVSCRVILTVVVLFYNWAQLVYTRYKLAQSHLKADGFGAIKQLFCSYKHKPFPYKKLIIIAAINPALPLRFCRRILPRKLECGWNKHYSKKYQYTEKKRTVEVRFFVIFIDNIVIARNEAITLTRI